MMALSRCRSCDAEVLWGVSATSGKLIPLDPEPRADGNLVVVGDRVHSTADQGAAVQAAMAAGASRYVSHFATCPQAARWRQRK